MVASRKRFTWLLGFLGLTIFVAACGFSLRSSESLDIDGSSTVFPIIEAVVEEYGHLIEGSVRVTVGISGTGGGFQKFCNGETDITNASRPVKEIEVLRCAEAGIEFIEIPVALDGVTVVVHLENLFVSCVTIDELHTMWEPKAEDVIKRWSQVRPDWPDTSMQLFGPGVDSGTFDYFTKTVNGKSQVSRGDFTASERDHVLVQGISGEKNSLGYFGFAFFEENKDKLNAVAIDGGDGCVTPSRETINNDTYVPLSRPLFIYVNKDVATRPDVQEFVRFFMGETSQQLVAEVGYVPFPPDVYDLALARFENGVTGTLFGGANPKEGSLREVLSANQ